MQTDSDNSRNAGGNPARAGRTTRALLAVAVVLLVAAGIFALSAAYGRPGSQAPVPTPTFLSARATETVQQRGGGVSGPQPHTSTPTVSSNPTAAATPVQSSATPTSTFTPTPLPPDLLALSKIKNAAVPARDPYALAQRLMLKKQVDLPRTAAGSHPAYEVGHTDIFNISDVGSRRYYTVSATIRNVTEHAYWYVRDGQKYDPASVDRLSSAFENKIHPTDRSIFGSEWTPGVDNDPHITVLFTPLNGEGGHYSAADEYTRAVGPFSNEREMIYISTTSGYAGLESTLAHEFQHMIHWHEHPNQDIWLNEGSSMLAEALNGYDVQGTDADFMRQPGVQLNAWEPTPSRARGNYGASLLFLQYLMDRYGGKDIIKAVIAAPQPGTEAVDSALAGAGYKEGFLEVFKKWVVANLVSTSPVAPAQYRYPERAVQVSPQVLLDHYPTGYSGQAAQFGADYIELKPPAKGDSLHVDFAGRPDVPVIGAQAHSGTGIYWSNRGDLADSTMTREFDLSGVRSATLECYIWFDIEQDFDHAYLEASTDGGASWDTLKGRYTTTNNPNGTNYGNAYTGKSGDKTGSVNGWLRERIDLGNYAGKQVLLRAEYTTDDSYNAQGLAIDDISIPELGYTDDAEHDNGWQGDGFVRVDNMLPQSYYLAVVRFSAGGVDVQAIPIAANNIASFDVSGIGPGGAYNRAVLIVAGTTTHNIQRAPYDLSVRPGK